MTNTRPSLLNSLYIICILFSYRSLAAPAKPEVPDAWTCPEDWYGDEGCDCGCGVIDIDCPDALASSCEYYGRCNIYGTAVDLENNAICIEDICGNAQVVDESCDDGNLIDGDGCGSNCQVERGYYCGLHPEGIQPVSVCEETPENTRCPTRLLEDDLCHCGCDVIDPVCPSSTLEECEIIGGCYIEQGEVIDPASPQNCVENTCGDGWLAQAEVCDDGNLNNGDGCSSVCQVELGFECEQRWVSGQERSICAEKDDGCSNRIQDGLERDIDCGGPVCEPCETEENIDEREIQPPRDDDEAPQREDDEVVEEPVEEDGAERDNQSVEESCQEQKELSLWSIGVLILMRRRVK